MGNFNNLPTDILLDIITLLPTESILHCKAVCKPWKNLISHHQSFSQMHLTRLQVLDSGKLSFLVFGNQELYYFEYNDQKPIHSTRRINLTPPFASSYYGLGSFNGLVCLHGRRDRADQSYCICNPMTKEYVVLPDFCRDSDCGGQYIYWSSGFGLDSVTNEYKVVELLKLSRESNLIEAVVYTLGSGNGWRSAGRLDTKMADTYVGYGVFANGGLHWMGRRGENVFVFDLAGEKFLEHVSPPPLREEHDFCNYSSIGVLGGVLYCASRYYCQCIKCTCCDIWLLDEKFDNLDMKDQVEHPPLVWRKEFSLVDRREPFAFTKCGGVLCFDASDLCIYDPIASTSIKLVDFSKFSRIIPHRNTLLSLRDLGEEDLKIMESAEMRRQKRDLKRNPQARGDPWIHY